MTSLSLIGVEITLSLLAIYAVYIIITKIILSHGSLKDTESIHRALILAGGVLIGLGIGGQDRKLGESGFFEPGTYLGLLLTFAGIVLISLAILYLKSSIWTPLEDISEYSAEFGKSFIATRLPITGGLELQRFSERFNENILILANKVATFQIQIEYLENEVKQTVVAGNNVSNQSRLLADYVTSYSDLSDKQKPILVEIDNQLSEFVSWYSETQLALSEQLIELRSVSEFGNLLAVNAAVEAANIEEKNPGFETIASKLHDLARSLEDRQQGLRVLIEDISIKNRDLNRKISDRIRNSLDISEDIGQIATQVGQHMMKLKNDEEGLSVRSNKLLSVISEVNQNIPKSY